jgi:hypothetical protein
MNKKTIDCKSQEGVTIGLIDSIISISRVLVRELALMESSNKKNNLTKNTQNALSDLVSDSDFITIVRKIEKYNKTSNDISVLITNDYIDEFKQKLEALHIHT